MAGYVDGFIVPVPKKQVKQYLEMAKLGAKLWREHGAVDYQECMADDVSKGKVTSFPRAVKAKAGEVVFFSWIVYKSRAHRDRVNAKVMSDPRLAEFMDPDKMPFDGMRMIYGGFSKEVSMPTAKKKTTAKRK